MKIKKILSVFLSMLLFLNPILSGKASAMDQKTKEEYFLTHCPKKNSKGGYVYDSCAWKEAEEALLNGTDYVVMRDQGPYGNEDLYFFTFRALDKILDELGLDPSEDTLREEWQGLEKERISYFSPLNNLLKVSGWSLIGALIGNGLYDLARAERHLHKGKDKIEFLKRPARAVYKLGVGMMNFIGAACMGLITSVWLKISHDLAEKKEYEIFNKEYKIYKLNNKKADALNLMLQRIKDSNYLLEDETIFFAKTAPKQLWQAYPINLEGLNYTEEEKVFFPGEFKKLARDIEKNLGRRLKK